MTDPISHISQVVIPLPSDDAIRKVVGKSYDPATAPNVVRVFAGTGDMFEATTSLVTAVFQAQGNDPKTREMMIRRAAKALGFPYGGLASLRRVL